MHIVLFFYRKLKFIVSDLPFSILPPNQQQPKQTIASTTLFTMSSESKESRKLTRPTVGDCMRKFKQEIKGRTFFVQLSEIKEKLVFFWKDCWNPYIWRGWDCQDGENKAFPQVLAGPRSRTAIPGTYGPKETVAVTMCSNPAVDLAKSWNDSRVRKKLSSVMFVGYVRRDENVLWHEAIRFDETHELFQQLEEDYAQIQAYFQENNKTSSKVGKLLQVRTKGPGGDKKSWAFYLRKQFLLKLFGNLKE